MKLPKAPPTALWINTLGSPRSARIALIAACSSASLVTSHGYARELGMSFSRFAMRSRFRASIATAYPPCEKRRAIAAPVPGPTPVTTATGFVLATSSFLLWLAYNPVTFQPRNLAGAIAQFCKEGGVIGAKDGSHRAYRRRRAIKASRRPRHPDFPELLSLEFFEDVILADLLVLQQLEAAQHRRRWYVVGEQPGQNVVGAPLLQFRGSYSAPLDCVYRSVACGFEAGIANQVFSVQRTAHTGPFVVR